MAIERSETMEPLPVKAVIGRLVGDKWMWSVACCDECREGIENTKEEAELTASMVGVAMQWLIERGRWTVTDPDVKKGGGA